MSRASNKFSGHLCSAGQSWKSGVREYPGASLLKCFFKDRAGVPTVRRRKIGKPETVDRANNACPKVTTSVVEQVSKLLKPPKTDFGDD